MGEGETRIYQKGPLTIGIHTPERKHLNLLKEEFTALVEGCIFTPQYKSGNWDGRICMISMDGSMPYGLLTDLLRAHKKLFPEVKIRVDDSVKEMYRRGASITPNYDLSLVPYPYQTDCIEKSLTYGVGIVRSSVSSGKSLMISYIIKTLLESGTISNCLLLVPNKSLVEQFYSDMGEYGLSNIISVGRVYQKYKDWDNQVVIATWQTMMNNTDRLPHYQSVIVDETHTVRGKVLRDILSQMVNAKFRLGFTGTMPPGKLESWNVKSFLGPIIADYSSGELAEQGYISKCNVRIYNIQYQNDYNGTYDDVKDAIFNNEFRLNMVRNIIQEADSNILVLVGKVAKEGDILKEWLETRLEGKEIVFLSGRDDVDKREMWRKECEVKRNIVLIATYAIFQQGINIPSLKYILLASPFKSKVRVLQSVGRALRKHIDKKDGAWIYDIQDVAKYLDKHGNIRSRYYSSEGFNVEDIVVEEGQTF